MAQRERAPASLGVQRQGILADDLTGAGDTALQFLQACSPPRGSGEVWIVPELHERVSSGSAPAQAAVISVNVESRHALPAEAMARVEQAARFLLRAGCTQVYKKIDSTLRGNLAVEILQALRSLELELAVVVPAFPQAGRITVGGYQLVDGVPVNASAYGRDPITPVKHAHLPTLLAEHADAETIAHLSLADVMTGPEAVANAIIRAVAGRRRLLVVDAARPEDMLAIARGMALTPYRLLPVGSAGLAKAMQPLPLLEGRRGVAARLAAGDPVLTVSGSLNPVSRAQVEFYGKSAEVIEVDVRALLIGQTDTVERAIGRARQFLLARHDVLLTTAASEATLRAERTLARNLALGNLQVGATLTRAFGEIVARLVAETKLAGLVLAGGDTALGVCRALGGGRAAPMRLTGELLPAVPLCRLDHLGGTLRLVTKSGGFGAPDALAELAKRLRQEADN